MLVTMKSVLGTLPWRITRSENGALPQFGSGKAPKVPDPRRAETCTIFRRRIAGGLLSAVIRCSFVDTTRGNRTLIRPPDTDVIMQAVSFS